MIADESGNYHMVELKFITGNAVNLSPHQVSWLTRHQHTSAWILIKKQKTELSKSELFLYRGSDSIDVKIAGIKTEPVLHLIQPFNWSKVFQKISPLVDNLA